MNFEIRAATQAEMGQLGQIGAYVYAGAFGDGEDNQVAAANRPEWTLCAFDGPIMAASFCTIPFTMRALGKPMPLGGITAVGTLPEYRRQGLLRSLMTRSLSDMREAGRPVAALWASQAAIYQRYGCAMTSVMRRYEVDTVDIGFYDGDWGDLAVRRVSLDACFDRLKQCYATFVQDRLQYIHRATALWRAGILREDADTGPIHIALAQSASGDVLGYTIYTMRDRRVAHPARGQDFVIRDLVWLTPGAYRSLWRFVASHDLVGRVVWANAPADDPAPDLFAEPRMLMQKDNEGVWTRVVDAPAALAGRGYLGEGELVIEITTDSLCPWNTGRWQLTVSGGDASVQTSNRPADITLDIRALALLFSGFRSATALAAAGLLEAKRPAQVLADRVFATPFAPHCPDHF
ncbi:MAG: enhanced intracellular survival protein Eis [Pseudomonadota bacterium]